MATSGLNEEIEQNIDNTLEPIYDKIDDEYKPEKNYRRYRRLDSEQKVELLAQVANGQTNISLEAEGLLDEEVSPDEVIGWMEEGYFPRTEATPLEDNEDQRLDGILEPFYGDLEDEYKPKHIATSKRYEKLEADEKAETIAAIVNGETNIQTDVEDLIDEEIGPDEVIGWVKNNYSPDVFRMLGKRDEDFEEIQGDLRNW